MVRQIAVGGMFAALAVAFTHALAHIPNVELTSLTLFMSGWILGFPLGPWVGGAAALALSLLNPFGFPNPVLLAAQVLGYGLWGALGALLTHRQAVSRLEALGIALGGTLVFQLLVNGALCFMLGASLASVFLPAVPFVAAHVTANMIFFGLLVPTLLPRMEHLKRQLYGR